MFFSVQNKVVLVNQHIKLSDHIFLADSTIWFTAPDSDLIWFTVYAVRNVICKVFHGHCHFHRHLTFYIRAGVSFYCMCPYYGVEHKMKQFYTGQEAILWYLLEGACLKLPALGPRAIWRPLLLTRSTSWTFACCGCHLVYQQHQPATLLLPALKQSSSVHHLQATSIGIVVAAVLLDYGPARACSSSSVLATSQPTSARYLLLPDS